MREELRARRDLFCKRLERISGMECLWPEATMFVMLDIRGAGLSAHDFATGLLESHDVSVLPADAFGPGARGHVRISLSASQRQLAEACERIAAYAGDLVA